MIPAYFIISYDVINQEEYQNYGPAVLQLLEKYDASVVVSDTGAVALEGDSKMVHAIVRFPSEEQALQCYHSVEYEDIKKIRLNSTINCNMILASNKDLLEQQ